jgi:SAM-dependent methyltransferase
MLIHEIKKQLSHFKRGRGLTSDSYFIKGSHANQKELEKPGSRTEIINRLLASLNRQTGYLEIGERDPRVNFNKINSSRKWSVDPGVELEVNLADFPCTSDEFFRKLKAAEWEGMPEKFDVIFVDGLHLAEQVDRDIANALEFLAEDGFIVIHDCNPPTEWHAREELYFGKSPSGKYWNGTTWKAFVKWRRNKEIYSCCVDTDWGVGIISKTFPLGQATSLANEFYEYKVFDACRKEFLNLISLEEFNQLMSGN